MNRFSALRGSTGCQLHLRCRRDADTTLEFVVCPRNSGTSDAEWDRLVKRFGQDAFTISGNALPEDATDKGKHTLLATVTAGEVSPIFVGLWGAVDVIRDPYSDAASGALRLTGLLTADVTVSRAKQIEILTNVPDRA